MTPAAGREGATRIAPIFALVFSRAFNSHRTHAGVPRREYSQSWKTQGSLATRQR
jgi:hypothetical protein